MDRFHASGNEFAMTLDDEDITQVLPCLYQDFSSGVGMSSVSCTEITEFSGKRTVPTEQRQRMTNSRVLTTHIPEQTDSFVLYVKAMVLLSKVKIFNLRFRAKFQGTNGAGEIDPRDTSAFKGLDGAIASFVASFPQEFRNPIPGGVVDTHLYVAHLVPHACVSLSLH